MNDPLLVYFSSPSLNTHRFVEKLGMRALRIPNSQNNSGDVSPYPSLRSPFTVSEKYILICPTFAAHDGRGAVPKAVIKFLNEPLHRELLQGVIASGSRNFGEFFAYSGNVISKKCSVPLLYKFELMGTPEDVEKVTTGIRTFWKKNVSRKVELPCV